MSQDNESSAVQHVTLQYNTLGCTIIRLYYSCKLIQVQLMHRVQLTLALTVRHKET